MVTSAVRTNGATGCMANVAWGATRLCVMTEPAAAGEKAEAEAASMATKSLASMIVDCTKGKAGMEHGEA